MVEETKEENKEYYENESEDESEEKQGHEKVQHENPEHKKQKLTGLDVWKLSTAVIAILLIISILTAGFGLKSLLKSTGTPTGAVILTKEEAANKAIEYINDNLLQSGMTAKLGSVEEKNDLYFIKMDIGGREYESYVTKDGSYLFPSGVNLNEKIEMPAQEQQPSQTITKTEKPEVELFVMSHCPFGTQAEKGILPVVKLLKDKIDFNIRYVYYAMHGKTELDEETLQYCIQSEQRDKFFNYLSCFLKEGKSDGCITEAKIDKEKLGSCINATDKEFKITEQFNDKSKWLNGRYPLFDVNKELNEKYGVGGSPTLVINGVKASSGRDSANFLKVICSAFNEEPGECQEKLSSASPSVGFGYEESEGTVTEASCS